MVNDLLLFWLLGRASGWWSWRLILFAEIVDERSPVFVVQKSNGKAVEKSGQVSVTEWGESGWRRRWFPKLLMADDCGEKDGEYVGVVGVSGEQRDGYFVPVEVSPLSWPRDSEAKAEL